MLRQGRSQGGSWGSWDPPNPIPLKLLRIKRVRTRHALRIRLIELWKSWMNWELRSINCYELVGYFGLQLARLCKYLVLRLRHLYRVPRTVTRVANVPYFPGRPVFRGLCPESRLGSSRDAKCPVFSWSQGQFFWCHTTPIHIKFHPETLKLMCMGREH